MRKLHRLTIRLPEDLDSSDYYIEDGLRKVYPYPYMYQSYIKRRWIGRKLKDVLKQEFRDISDEQLKFDALLEKERGSMGSGSTKGSGSSFGDM